ncbi:MAG: aconitase family protein, partial [Gemmataceae bacterium]
MTMIEKILARQAGRDHVTANDFVVCDVNMAVQTDISFLIDEALAAPKKIADPDRIAVVFDHRVPARTPEDAAAHTKGRRFVETWGIKRFFDVGNHGICHQVIQENGLALPGQILTCPDSHTIASGAFNCAARGLGEVDFAAVMATGKTWFRVPPAINIVLEGSKPQNVFGKDILLHLAGTLGSVEGRSVEFSGTGLGGLSIDDRTSLTTMCAEISADFALMPADDVLLRYLRDRTTASFQPVTADPSAEYAAVHVVDLAKL